METVVLEPCAGADAAPPASPRLVLAVDAGDTCAGCRFYKPNDETSGICRRYAPQGPVIWLAPQLDTFPPVKAVQWCGEFERPVAGVRS